MVCALVGAAFPIIAAEVVAPVRSPEEERATFQLASGLRAELVAAEPLVQDPVAMTFDERGRLWVVEMRGFMPNLDREGEQEKVGRVSVLEDRDGDGRMDHSTVFLDGLVLPRVVAVVAGGALIAENKPLWFAEDTDGDGRADLKTLVDADYGGTGMPEHSGNGLRRGFDGWYYNAKSTWRYRREGARWVREATEFRGQWGITHDDWGRLYYNFNWSQLHGDFVPPNYLSRNTNHTPSSGLAVGIATNQFIFPAHATPAVNRGYIPGVLDEHGRVREFTSAGAPLIYRGDALPARYRGNAFVCEPAANLIKANRLRDDGVGILAEPTETGREFLAATDQRFRPVFLADGPDGALYVADMYRGVIQHGAYMTPYLRQQSEQRGLVEPRHRGRIWRIVAADKPRPQPVHLDGKTSAELVAALVHPNGWVRDTTQRLLEERNDAATIPALARLAREATNAATRVQALWTLASLRGDAEKTIHAALNDPHPQVVAAALRTAEKLAANQRPKQESLFERLPPLLAHEHPTVRLQAVLTAGNVGHGRQVGLLAVTLASRTGDALMRDAVLSGLGGHEAAMLRQLDREPAWRDLQPGRAELIEALAAAVVRSGASAEIQNLLTRLDGAPDEFDWRQRAVLAGLALHAGRRGQATIALSAQPAVLRNVDAVTNRVVRARLEKLPRLFAWPGHAPEKVARGGGRPLTAAEEEQFANGRQIFTTVCAGCHGPDGAGIEPQGPPLLDSEWVLGDAGRLVRIILHGLEGPVTVAGTRYEPPRILTEMPALAVLDNASIAAVLTYIRREWGHAAEPLTEKLVSQLRVSAQGRGRPWTEKELLEVKPLAPIAERGTKTTQ